MPLIKNYLSITCLRGQISLKPSNPKHFPNNGAGLNLALTGTGIYLPASTWPGE
jgi:hypothetical protein